MLPKAGLNGGILLYRITGLEWPLPLADHFGRYGYNSSPSYTVLCSCVSITTVLLRLVSPDYLEWSLYDNLTIFSLIHMHTYINTRASARTHTQRERERERERKVVTLDLVP